MGNSTFDGGAENVGRPGGNARRSLLSASTAARMRIGRLDAIDASKQFALFGQLARTHSTPHHSVASTAKSVLLDVATAQRSGVDQRVHVRIATHARYASIHYKWKRFCNISNENGLKMAGIRNEGVSTTARLTPCAKRLTKLILDQFQIYGNLLARRRVPGERARLRQQQLAAQQAKQQQVRFELQQQQLLSRLKRTSS